MRVLKRKYLYYNLLTYIPLIITLITLPFFSKTIPAHYDIAGNIDRYGSKYENLILPCFIIIVSLITKQIITKLVNRNSKSAKIEQVIYYVCTASMLVLNVMTFLFLYKSFFLSKNLDEPFYADIYKIMFTAMGIFFIVTGNVVAKSKQNNIFGIRTHWTMKSDRVWFLCQKFGGWSLITYGVIVIFGNFFYFQGIQCLVFSIGGMLFLAVFIFIGTYYIAKKNTNT